jgi:hypothetical protein
MQLFYKNGLQQHQQQLLFIVGDLGWFLFAV